MVKWRGKNANIAISALKIIHYSNAPPKKKEIIKKKFTEEPLRNSFAQLDLASQGQHKVKTMESFILFHM